MKRNLSLAALAVLGALILVVLSGVPKPYAAHAQTPLSVAIDLSPSASVEEGTAIAVTMSFGSLTFDDDRATTDYSFRVDVKDSESGDADGCEDQAGGYGLGVDRENQFGGRGPGGPQRGHLRRLPGGGLHRPGQHLGCQRRDGTGLGHGGLLRDRAGAAHFHRRHPAQPGAQRCHPAVRPGHHHLRRRGRQRPSGDHGHPHGER